MQNAHFREESGAPPPAHLLALPPGSAEAPEAEDEFTAACRQAEMEAEAECALGVDYSEGALSPKGCPW